jgi:chromosome segregation ATPase
MSDDRAYLEARLAKTEQAIEAVEDKILALTSSTGAQSYEMDTGQTRARKTEVELAELRLTLAQLEDRRSKLRLLLCSGGVTHVIPGY